MDRPENFEEITTYNFSGLNFTKEEEELLIKGNKFNVKAKFNENKLEGLTVACEQI